MTALHIAMKRFLFLLPHHGTYSCCFRDRLDQDPLYDAIKILYGRHTGPGGVTL